MIKSISSLREHITKDMNANGFNHSNKLERWIKYQAKLIFGYESAAVCNYLRVLRKYEFFTNIHQNLITRTLRDYYKIRHLRLGMKYSIKIWPNCVEYGLCIPHIAGGGVIINALHMGKNCIVNSGVVIGNKNSQDNRATIGANVYMSLGSKVIGKVLIGDNSIIAPNAVVVKDIPPNTICGGVPAKIIRYVE